MDAPQLFRVAARVRPQQIADGSADEKKDEKRDDSIVVAGNRISLTSPQKEAKSFEFAACHDRQDSNAKVFADNVAPMIDKVISGINCFVLTWGAKASGKAHTLYGDKADPVGVIPQAIDSLFAKVDQAKNVTDYFVTLSVFHLREKGSLVVDLLNPRPTEVLQLNNHRALGTYVEPLAEIEVSSAEEAKSLLKQAVKVQHALTLRTPTMNYGHTFVDIKVDAKDRDKPFVIRQAVLRFVMTQGSGGAAVKSFLGLGSLAEVLADLAADKALASINFAQSALTRLLESGLGGNAHTLLLLFVTPGEQNASDTENTLQLGDKAKQIRNTPKVNVNTIETAIKQLREEIKSSMKRLQLNQPRQYYHDVSPAQLNNVKQLMQELERVKKLSWDERRKASTQAKLDRIDNLRKEGLASVRHEVELDPKRVEEARELLDRVADSMQALQELQIRLEEKEALLQNYHRSRANKGAGVEGDGKEQKAPPGMLKNIQKLQTDIGGEQTKLNTLEDEYKKRLFELMDYEAKKRMYDVSPESARVLQQRQLNDWQAMRKTMDKNPKLTQQKEEIKQRHDRDLAALDPLVQAVPAEVPTREELKNKLIQMNAMTAQQDSKLAEVIFERNFLWTQLIENQYRSQVQMERYQQHMFFVFRDYRSHFEQQKNRIENRYRELLENSVKDALKLAEDNARLRAELAKLQERDPSGGSSATSGKR